MEITKTELKNLIKEVLQEELGRKPSRKLKEASKDEIDQVRTAGMHNTDSDQTIAQVIDDFGFDEAHAIYFSAGEFIDEEMDLNGLSGNEWTWETDPNLYLEAGDWSIVVKTNNKEIYVVDGDANRGHRNRNGDTFTFRLLEEIPSADYEYLSKKYPAYTINGIEAY